MGLYSSHSPDGHIAAKPTNELFATFGDFLRFLRRRERLTQTDLGIAVGYSTQHIHLLESGQRLPDPTTVAALFVPALRIESHADFSKRLVELAAAARAQAQAEHSRRGRGSQPVEVQREVLRIETTEEVGRLEAPPAAPPLAIERAPEMDRLRERLSSERHLALCGLPGMGKSTLAAEFARKYAGHGPLFWLTFSEGINTSVDALVRQLALFVVANAIAPPAQLSQLIARGPDSPPLSPNVQILLLSSALTEHAAASALLCFDNAHLVLASPSAEDPLIQLLTRLMATSPASFLFLSRQDLPMPGLAHIQLNGMDRGEASDFMGRLLEQHALPNGLTSDLLGHLYERTEGNPMLLRLALGQMPDSHLDAARFVEQLATQPQIDSYLLGTIIGALSPSARQLASLISIFRQPVNLYDPTLVDLMQERDVLLPEGGPSSALAELQHRHLLDNPRQAALHPLLRDYMASTLAAETEQWRKMHLLAAHYSEQGLGDIVEAAYHYCRAGNLEEMAGALADQGASLFSAGKGQAALEVLDDGLTQVRRKRTVPMGLLRRLLTVRGDLLNSSLRAGEAETNYREALAVALQEKVVPPVQAQIMARLASCLTQRGQAPEALELCNQALAMLGTSDTLLVAQLTTVQSGALAIVGRFEEAEASGKRALELSNNLMATLPSLVLGIRARTYNVLGMVSAIRQRHDDALRYWSNAIEAARQLDYVQLEYRCRGNVGNIYFERGDLERATRYCLEAVNVLKSIGDEYGAVRFMHTLGNAQYLRLHLDEALATMENAANIKRSMGDHPGAALSLGMQGMALLSQGHNSRAKAQIEEALREIEGTEATRSRGYLLMMLCDAEIASGDLKAANATLEHAANLAGVLADIKWVDDLQNHRALALLSAGDLEAARRVATEPLSPEPGIEITMTRDLINGAISHLSGDEEAALSQFEQVAAQAHDAEYFLYEATAHRLIVAQRSLQRPMLLAKSFYS